MDKNYINDLLRINFTENATLREEVIRVITQHRALLEDIHISAIQNGDRSGEHLSGLALGKPGYFVGDCAI